MKYAIQWLIAGAALAQNIESFRIELTGSAWLADTAGTIQSGLTPIDLASDLALERSKPMFLGRLVAKPSRRNRLIVEGLPYRLTGSNTVSRQFTFNGRTYSFQDQVTSTADIDYVFGGYQRDFVSRSQGHLGLGGGIAYVDATGTIRSQNFGFTGTEHQSFPFPLVGLEGRAFLIPRSGLLNINGEVKGMSLGDYGHYVDARVSGGIGLGRHLTIEAGYRLVDADVHRKDQTRGFAPHFTGPVFSVQIRD
jgi:hypothetical protein